MKSSFREFVKTGRGKLTVALCALGVSWLFLLWQFSGSFAGLMPSEDRISNIEREIKQLKQQNTQLRSRKKANDELKKLYLSRLEGYWNEERDGAVDTELRNRVQQAAREVDLKLNTLGSVRVSPINSELYYAEIDLSTSGPVETLVHFLGKIQEISPKLAWRRLELRPDAGRNAESPGSLVLNGAIRVIGFDKNEADSSGGAK
ncbi:MAG: hypothetical protein LBM70_09205 [Victivallales bacterium]|jgi:hypothetical protein|nr:hypothetical protein [Victivallales bacterium]